MMVNRRAWMRGAASFGVLVALSSVAFDAFAGSYLSRASMLLRGAELEANALRARLYDKELARVSHELALSRCEAARAMQVPDEVKRAHPHLLLVLEAFERASDAAVRGRQNDFLVALEKGREEAKIFRAVLKREGWALPN